MRPVFTSRNIRNSLLLDTIYLSNFLLAMSRLDRHSDEPNIHFRELCRSVFRTNLGSQASSESVQCIFAYRYYFKILQARVALVPIFVIRLKSAWYRSDESLDNEPVNISARRNSVFVKFNGWIKSLYANQGFENSSWESSQPRSDPFNLTLIRNFIQVLIVFDWFPEFFHKDNSISKIRQEFNG